MAEHLSPQPPPTAARLPKVAAAAPPRRLLGSRVEVEQSSSSSSTPGPDRSNKQGDVGGVRGRQQPAALLRQLTPLLLLGQTSRVGSVRLRFE